MNYDCSSIKLNEITYINHYKCIIILIKVILPISVKQFVISFIIVSPKNLTLRLVLYYIIHIHTLYNIHIIVPQVLGYNYI